MPFRKEWNVLTFSLRLFGPDSYFFRKKAKEKIGEDENVADTNIYVYIQIFKLQCQAMEIIVYLNELYLYLPIRQVLFFYFLNICTVS